jgi:hypothetical protein
MRALPSTPKKSVLPPSRWLRTGASWHHHRNARFIRQPGERVKSEGRRSKAETRRPNRAQHRVSDFGFRNSAFFRSSAISLRTSKLTLTFSPGGGPYWRVALDGNREKQQGLTEASLSGVPGHPGPALGADWSALPTPCPRRAQTHRRGAPGARFDAPTTGSDWGRVGSATSPNRTRVVAKLYESFNLKKAVEPTQRRKGAETQGFRLVGAITPWVSYVTLVFPGHLPVPCAFASGRLGVNCRC